MTLLRRYVTWRRGRIERYRSFGFRTPRGGRLVMALFILTLFTSALRMPGWFYALVGLVLVGAAAVFVVDIVRLARHDENYRRFVVRPALLWIAGIVLAIALPLTVAVAMFSGGSK